MTRRNSGCLPVGCIRTWLPEECLFKICAIALCKCPLGSWLGRGWYSSSRCGFQVPLQGAAHDGLCQHVSPDWCAHSAKSPLKTPKISLGFPLRHSQACISLSMNGWHGLNHFYGSRSLAVVSKSEGHCLYIHHCEEITASPDMQWALEKYLWTGKWMA